MNKAKAIFVFLNLAFWLLPVLIGKEIPYSQQLFAAGGLIALVGIPHGAIDHILFAKNSSASPSFFYGFYLALISLIVLIWLFLPQVGLIVFLLISAYHFGQSQLSPYEQLSPYLKALLYLLWGSSILSALVVYNQDEINRICAYSSDLLPLLVVFQSWFFDLILVFSSVLFSLLFFHFRRRVGGRSFLSELLLLGLIHLSFYTQSILIGFSIYFATLHSMEVMQAEFHFLKDRLVNFNIWLFIRMLLPYSIVSLLGICVLLILSYYSYLPLSGTLVVMISISALTLPHSVVMEKFYSVIHTQVD